MKKANRNENICEISQKGEEGKEEKEQRQSNKLEETTTS